MVAGEEDQKTEEQFVEPIIIEETMPNDPGEWSLRLTTDYRKTGSEPVGALPEFEVFYGLIERLGISLSLPMAYDKPDTNSHYGLGDISFDLKYLVVKPGPTMPALVVGLETEFPTGNQKLGLGDGAYELTPFLALLKSYGPFCLQGNFGWSKQINGPHENFFNYGCALSAEMVKHKLYLLSEIQGDWRAPNHTTVAPGIKYYFFDNITLGAAVPIGLNSNTGRLGIVTQFQIEF
jgi:hypothetical protein